MEVEVWTIRIMACRRNSTSLFGKTLDLAMMVLISVISSAYSLLGRELHQRLAISLFTKPVELHIVLYAKYLALLTSLIMVSVFFCPDISNCSLLLQKIALAAFVVVKS